MPSYILDGYQRHPAPIQRGPAWQPDSAASGRHGQPARVPGTWTPEFPELTWSRALAGSALSESSATRRTERPRAGTCGEQGCVSKAVPFHHRGRGLALEVALRISAGPDALLVALPSRDATPAGNGWGLQDARSLAVEWERAGNGWGPRGEVPRLRTRRGPSSPTGTTGIGLLDGVRADSGRKFPDHEVLISGTQRGTCSDLPIQSDLGTYYVVLNVDHT